MIAAGEDDDIDPGASYYQFTYMINNAGHRQLRTRGRRRRGPTPDGAEDYPRIGRPADPDVHDPRRHGVRAAGQS